jgi:hypothetical protein
VINVNRKALLTVLVLSVIVLLAAPYIGMVNAGGKGQTKQYFKEVLTGFDHPGSDTKMWTADENILQARGFIYTAYSVDVTVGTTTYSLDPVKYSSTMDLMLNTVTLHGTIRVHETLTFADGSTLEILTAETLWNYGTPDMVAGGSFIGHGTGSLEGVIVQGTTSLAYGDSGPTRVGTIMGWP